MDRIELRGLRFHGRHGVEAWERRVGQPFLVDVVLHVDLARPGRSDAIADTVNYAEVYRAIQAIVEGRPARLIERVAERVAAEVLAGFPAVAGVAVAVHKPHAALGGPIDHVAVHIERWRRPDGGDAG